MGKNTLMSFWGKPSTSSNKSTPQKSQETTSSTTTTGGSSEGDVVGKRINGQTGTKRASCATPVSGDDENAIGKRLSVFWPKDNTWYAGVVVGFTSPKHHVKYDDGEEEQLVLANEKVKWEGVAQKRKKASDGANEHVGDGASKSCDHSTKSGDRTTKSGDRTTKPGDRPAKPSPKKRNEAADDSKPKKKRKTSRLSRRERIKKVMILDSSDEEEPDQQHDDSEDEFSDPGSASDDDDDVSVVDSPSEDEAPPPKKKRPAAATKKNNPRPTTPSKNPPTTPTRAAPSSRSTTPVRTPIRSPSVGGTGFGTPPWSSKSNRSARNITPARAFQGSASPSNSAPMSPTSGTGGKVGVLPYGDHEHHHLKWLAEDLKDGQLRAPSDPKYDHTSLNVPKGYIDGVARFHSFNNGRKITPGMRVWWEFKSKYFDCVIFYKVGKFYELYHMDADVGVRHLDLLYMKGDFAHCGFPEISYGKFSERLVQQGFRVARVEQTETPEQMKIRTKKSSGCVRRNVCTILSPGTRTLSFRDYKRGGLCELDTTVTRIQLLALAEIPIPPDQRAAEKDAAEMILGVTLLDPTTGRFRVGQFQDNHHRFNLRTMLAQERPAEIVIVRDGLSENTMSVLQHLAPAKSGSNPTLYTVFPALEKYQPFRCSTEFVQRIVNLDKAAVRGSQPIYFDQLYDNATDGKPPSALSYLQLLLSGTVNPDQDNAHVLPSEDSRAALASFSYTFHVLKRAFLDYELLSMGNIRPFQLPGVSQLTANPDVMEVDANGESDNLDDGSADVHMVLDGQALTNLEILESSTASISSKEGSLYGFVNRCTTNFGARQLRRWVSAPLFNVQAIRRRQRKVSGFVSIIKHCQEEGLADFVGVMRNAFRQVPDLERLLARIHALGLKHSAFHPDSLAVLYENDKYNKTKIDSLVSSLRGLRLLRDAMVAFSESITTHIPKDHVDAVAHLVTFGMSGSKLVDIQDELAFFDRSFDLARAKKNGFIDPTQGTSEDYDRAVAEVQKIRQGLDDYLDEQRGCIANGKTLKYWHPANGRDTHQIEVSEAVLPQNRDAPKHWNFKSKKKGYRRFHTSYIVNQLKILAEAELKVEAAKADITRLVFEKFDKNRDLWASIVDCASECDCLISLALVSAMHDEESPMVCPEIVDPAESEAGPMLHLVEARHPCVAAVMEKNNQGSFIPNDTFLGAEGKGKCLLLTGPNMGGKSTLLRQTCIAVIMAQIGCYVPARECRMTPVDRIFTRVGASDQIMAGHSTFFVELSETTTILRAATPHSLTILDELGRGTSTFDGTAIAYAVVKELCRIGCRMLFATHYHSLVQEFSQSEENSKISLGHMTCFANEEASSQEDGDTKSAATPDVTFLYKLGDGPSDKSYGLNVARLAKLPADVIEKAHVKSEEFEQNFKLQHSVDPVEALVRKVMKAAEDKNGEALLASFKAAVEAAL